MTASTRTAKIDRIIQALLEQGTIRKAAVALNMSEVTVRRWRQKPEFQQAYRTAQREALSRANGRLLQGASAAASIMCKVMVDPNTPPAVQVRAAAYILQQAQKGFELEQLTVRVEQLEQAIQKPCG